MTFIVVFEVCRRKSYSFDLLSVFNAFYLIYYPFATFNMLVFPGFLAGKVLAHYAFAPQITPWCVFSQWVYYFCFVGAPSLAGRYPILPFRAKSSESLYYVYIIWAGYVVAFFALLLWSTQYGGLISTIRQADLIREGLVSLETAWAFMQQFYLSVPFLASVFVWLLYQARSLSLPGATRGLMYALIPFAFIVTILVFLVFASRGKVAYTALSIALIFMWRPFPVYLPTLLLRNFFKLFVGGLCAFIALFLGNAVFGSLGRFDEGVGVFVDEVGHQISEQVVGGGNAYFSIVGNFLHLTFSIDAATDAVVVSKHLQPSFGVEVLDAAITIVPTRLTGRAPGMTLQQKNVMMINPLYFTDDHRGGGSIPAGAIAGSIYMFSFFGPFALPIILGIGVKRLECFVLTRLRGVESIGLVYVTLVFMLYPLLIGFDPHMYKVQVIPLCWWSCMFYAALKYSNRRGAPRS